MDRKLVKGLGLSLGPSLSRSVLSLSIFLCHCLSPASLSVYLSLWLSVSISLSISMSPSLPPSLTVYPIELYPSLSPLPLPLPLLSIYIFIYLLEEHSISRLFYLFAHFYLLSTDSLSLSLTLSLLTLSLTFLTTVAATVHKSKGWLLKIWWPCQDWSSVSQFFTDPQNVASQTSPLQQSPWYMFQLDTISRHVYPTYPTYPVHPAYPIMFKFDMSNSWAGAKFFASNEYEKRINTQYDIPWTMMHH